MPLAGLLLATSIFGSALAPPRPPDESKRICAYSDQSVARLRSFGRLVGRDFNCALVSSNANATWAEWERPWFISHASADRNWARWAAAGRGSRQLVITLNLIPDDVRGVDWRSRGARGAYEAHARRLARHLVAAHLGDSVIRLSPEANGDWYSDSIGDTRGDATNWARFWRRTVRAMRSVPGAHFRFDWCVNAGYRPVPLSAFYPGDDAVDIVGVDAYDSGVPDTDDRWSTIYTRTDGIRDVLRFARIHGKPFSIPEWGVGPRGDHFAAGGDDGAYVDGIASVVRNNRVAYEGYFFKYGWASELAHGERSLASYRRHFGSGGDSAERSRPDPRLSQTAAVIARAGVPALRGALRVRAGATVPGTVCFQVVERGAAGAIRSCRATTKALAYGRHTFSSPGVAAVSVRRSIRGVGPDATGLVVVALFRPSAAVAASEARRVVAPIGLP